MGFSPLSALTILAFHFIGMQLYLLFLKIFVVAHTDHCKDENCVFNNMTNIKAYTQAVLWPIYTIKWIAIAKGWL